MKRIFLYVSITLAMTLVSCEDYLNTTPPDKASPETFLQTMDQARNLLAGIYNTLYDTEQAYMRPYVYDNMSDNSYNHHSWEYSMEFAQGTQTSSSRWAQYKWERDYLCIARCNSLLRGLPGASLTDTERGQVEGEARFMRAMTYLDLIQFYGRVPLIDENTPQENPPRSPIADLLALMKNDVQFAIDNLPHSFDAGTANKGAAYMLKLRIAQYENDNQVVIHCAQAIKNLGYTLYRDYRNLFLDAGIEDPANKEVLFKVNYDYDHKGSYICRVFLNWSSFSPTLAAVNSFFTSNGLPLSDITADNGEVISRDATHNPDFPFRDRDPRLKASILVPGEEYRIDAMGYYAAHWVPRNNSETKTGFTTRKACDERQANLDRDPTDKILMRYGETLLAWAESENELNGPAGAYPLIDELRNRAGMITLSRSLPNLTKATMRELIRNERRVELFIEGQRWFDIRRWGIAEKVMVNAEGLNIDKMVNYPTNGGVSANWQYEPRLVDTRRFDKDRDYLWPIPMKEINANPLIKDDQNPGYN
jgi:hypothetical protein